MIELIQQKITDFIARNMICPEHCSYDQNGVLVKNEMLGIDMFMESPNPRLAFCRTLSFFPCKIRMYQRGLYENSFLMANNTVWNDRRVLIGEGCVIGGVGFGYEKDENGCNVPIPHFGRVRIGDGVIIHNKVCIDRAVIGETVIGEGTVIDNLVHVAHNVKIGKNCQIVAGAVLGGSCEIGNGTFIGMNASIKNKVKIGANVIIGAGAVVITDVPDNETWAGCPAVAVDVKSKYGSFEATNTYDNDFSNYILGFVDGEAFFTVCKHGKTTKSFVFGIELSKKDKQLLHEIKDFFGVGVIYERVRKTLINKLNSRQYAYNVRNKKDLLGVIIPFFDNHKLRGFKKVQYKRWREEYLDYINEPKFVMRNFKNKSGEEINISQFLSTKQLVSKSGVSLPSIERMKRAGELQTAHEIGNRHFYDLSAVEKVKARYGRL